MSMPCRVVRVERRSNIFGAAAGDVPSFDYTHEVERDISFHCLNGQTFTLAHFGVRDSEVVGMHCLSDQGCMPGSWMVL